MDDRKPLIGSFDGDDIVANTKHMYEFGPSSRTNKGLLVRNNASRVCVSRVGDFWIIGRQTGSYPETSFAEISGDVLEAEF